ncbi:putative oxidoreductase [Camellia lanceoleosa]|uniref:Oxidoreductase n=1 Tax=Camellia lanceoleosa TaxID=1840588 RepID=A0ACC0HRX2_9ERIC|nr:putative oxidoreductase [Camellia lanceoleosa]
MSENKPVRFGILGCANIARKVSRAIRLSPNATLQAIGSRSIDKASKFASENGFPDSANIYGSYEALLDNPEVDAVYVPLPTSLHLKWAVLAAEKKKHLLLEKPVALNVSELDKILEACESNGVQYMDATMWMHHPRTAKMKEFLADPERFGKIKSHISNGNLRIHDFVIPFQENVGQFYAASKSKFAELALGCEPIPSEHAVMTDLPQEALMVSEFARLAANIEGNGSKPEKKWPTISRKTQLVLDAVKASIEKGFEPVEVGN